jgi:5-methylcytosine-specific restriction endonuclease McrA
MIVHHRVHLNPMNVQEPSISLCYDNLELLCMDCHNREHFGEKIKKRYEVDEDGHIIMIE